MARQYFTLLIRDDSASPWRIDFGDYNEQVVDDERYDRWEADELITNMKIIKTSDKQADIDAAVAKLNERFSK